MNKWYLIKVKYIKELEDGTLKKVSEPYLVPAVSFTDAEAKINEEVGAYVRGEFDVTSMATQDFNDIFAYDSDGSWFKAKVNMLTVDADSGKESKQSVDFLLNSNSVKQAYERLDEQLKGFLVNTEVVSVSKTKIVDVFQVPEVA